MSGGSWSTSDPREAYSKGAAIVVLVDDSTAQRAFVCSDEQWYVGFVRPGACGPDFPVRLISADDDWPGWAWCEAPR